MSACVPFLTLKFRVSCRQSLSASKCSIRHIVRILHFMCSSDMCDDVIYSDGSGVADVAVGAAFRFIDLIHKNLCHNIVLRAVVTIGCAQL